MLGDLLDGRDDVGEVGILCLPEWRRNADVDGIEAREDAEISRCRQTARGGNRGHVLSRDVSHVRFTVPDAVDLRRIDVEADRLEAGLGELDRKRETDVAEADDARARLAGADLLEQRVSH